MKRMARYAGCQMAARNKASRDTSPWKWERSAYFCMVARHKRRTTMFSRSCGRKFCSLLHTQNPSVQRSTGCGAFPSMHIKSQSCRISRTILEGVRHFPRPLFRRGMRRRRNRRALHSWRYYDRGAKIYHGSSYVFPFPLTPAKPQDETQ